MTSDWQVNEEFQQSLEISNHWYNRASDLNASATILNWAHGQSDLSLEEELGFGAGFKFDIALSWTRVMVGGMALEAMFKACLVRKKKFDFKRHSRGHDLVKLAKDAEINYDANQMDTLDVMTDVVVWFGRYPIPKSKEKISQQRKKMGKLWKHKEGTLFQSPDPKKWPNSENYSQLWSEANKGYWKISPEDPREFGY